MNAFLVAVAVCGVLLCSARLANADEPTTKPAADAAPPDLSKYILTPPAAATPRVNGPKVFGVRPGRPVLYTIPATGERPMTFAVDNLPAGLSVDVTTGRITGKIDAPGEYAVTLKATNARGTSEKPFKIIVGDKIALTPPMGWNSWNCWAKDVDREKVLASAKAMVEKGLINHGWTYINIDDAWQGVRGGEFNAIQPNEKFPDMKGLCDEVHNMGLKIGIYSSPWITSYAMFNGGSSNDPDGKWDSATLGKNEFRTDGKHLFAENDAKQWAAWGIDYLEYDWNPKRSTPPMDTAGFKKQVADMAKALKDSGRDIVYSYSNSFPFEAAAEVTPYLNCWRTTGDIRDSWWSLTSIGFTQDKWADYAKPGQWNDPDMLVLGLVGWSKNLHPTKLTPDEQYTHISLWALLSSPLLIGCPIERMDDFTLSLLTNDEVIAINQDTLGKTARLVGKQGPEVKLENVRPGRETQVHTYVQGQVWARELDDGSRAVGLFNLGTEPMTVAANWSDLKIEGKHVVRDVWRQKDVGEAEGKYEATISPHGCVLLKLTPEK